MKRSPGKLQWIAVVAGGVLVVAALLLARTFLPSPLPAPAPYAGPIPPSSPPPTMAMFRLMTGVTHRNAGVAYRGGSLRDKRDFTMGAVLVKHPRGDLLVDTGLGTTVTQQVQEMPAWFRAVTTFERSRSASEQLDAAHYDRRALRGILLTHAHWDHLSGVSDLPGVPVLVTRDERRFIETGGFVTALARDIDHARFEPYDFEGGAYLGFAKSHDVFGDGSVVVVPAPGHTPGSVIVFVSLPGGRRYAFLGDLVWQLEGITEREERPWVTRSLADDDEAGVREGILHVAAIAARFPHMVLVPAHDARGFEHIPDLVAR